MKRKYLLWAAAFFTLFTFAGHTAGAIKGPRLDQPGVASAWEVMQTTKVMMPMATERSIATLMSGANYALSIYMLVAGLLFLLVSSTKEASPRRDNQILFINSAGIGATAVLSGLCFFPLPAICLGLSSAMGFIATTRKPL